MLAWPVSQTTWHTELRTQNSGVAGVACSYLQRSLHFPHLMGFSFFETLVSEHSLSNKSTCANQAQSIGLQCINGCSHAMKQTLFPKTIS